jgi:hypothetical protein
MDEFPARRRLLGQSDPPRNRPEPERGPATPDVVDEDVDLFGAEDAASGLIERLKNVQPAAALLSDDGELDETLLAEALTGRGHSRPSHG